MVALSANLIFSAIGSAQIIEPLKKQNPVKLEMLVPELDLTNPQKRLEGRISDSFNPEVLEIPQSGAVKAYEIGRKLFDQGDYRRAMNAFQLAMIRANEYGARDPRFQAAKAAIDATKSRLSMRAKLGYDTDNKNAIALVGRVTKVFPPSLAWLGGLKKDDRIINARIESSAVHLKVQRGSKLFNLSLKTPVEKKIRLSGQRPALDRSDRPTANLAGTIEHPEVLTKYESLLANYDCALLIDCSGSMGSSIGSGDSSGKRTTRWDWCKENIAAFCRSGGKYFPRGITLVPFNQQFAVSEHATLEQLAQIYQKLGPDGGTELEKPLDYIINDYFDRKARGGNVKPLAIAILSDGQVFGDLIRQVVVNATVRMKHPNELIITFLQVAGDDSGSSVIRALDDEMTEAGAAYDIVDSRTFDELSEFGLMKVIVAALVEKRVEGR